MERVIEEWLDQLRSCNGRIQTALAALALFGTVLCLTILANAFLRMDVQNHNKELTSIRNEIDGIARNVYLNPKLNDGAFQNHVLPPVMTILSEECSLDPGLVISSLRDPKPEVALSDIQGLYRNLVEYQSACDDLLSCREKGQAYSDLTLEQRNELCEIVFFGIWAQDRITGLQFQTAVNYAERLEPLAQGQFNNQLQAAALGFQLPAEIGGIPPVSTVDLGQQIIADPLPGLEDPVKALVAGQTLHQDVLAQFGFANGIQPTIPAWKNYQSLDSQLNLVHTQWTQLQQSGSVTIPLVNFTIDLAVIGFTSVAASLGLAIYLWVLRIKMAVTGSNLLRAGIDPLLLDSLIIDCPMVSRFGRWRGLLQAFVLSLPALVASGYQAIELLYLSGDEGNPASTNEWVWVWLLIFASMVVLVTNYLLKMEYQSLAESLGLRECLLGKKCDCIKGFQCQKPRKMNRKSTG